MTRGDYLRAFIHDMMVGITNYAREAWGRSSRGSNLTDTLYPRVIPLSEQSTVDCFTITGEYL